MRTTIFFLIIHSLILFATHAQDWEKLSKTATEAYKNKDYISALDQWEKAKQQAMIEFGATHHNYINSCLNIAKVFEKQNNYKQAATHYLQVRDLLEANLGKEHLEYADVCHSLGKMNEKQGLYTQAEPLFLEAQKIRETKLGRQHEDYLKSCTALASLYEDLGLLDKAETQGIEAKDLSEKIKGNQHPDYAEVCNTLGLIYFRKGAYNKAETLCLEAQAIFIKKFGKEHEDYAKACYNLAKIYRKKGLFHKAEALFIESKLIREKTLGKKHPKYAQSCDNLAGLYRIEGFFDRAEPLFIEAKNIREEVLGKSHPNYATSCQNLALLYQDLKQYDKTESLMKECKNIREINLGKNHPSYASACHNLARFYEEVGKFVEAETMHLEAKEIRAQTLGKLHPDYGKSCFSLAKLYEAEGLLDKAEPLLIEAIDIFVGILGKKHPNYAQYITQLGELYEKKEFFANAIPLYMEASQSLIGQTEDNFSHLSEKEKGLFYGTFNTYFEHYNSFLLKNYQRFPHLIAWIYNNTLITKALLFNATNKIRDRIYQSKNEQLIRLYTIWKNKKEVLAKAYQTPEDEKEDEINIKVLEDEVNQMEKELSTKSEYFAQKSEKTRYQWTDIQQKLKKNEAAVEIIRTRYYDKAWTDSVIYFALIIRPETQKQPEIVILPDGKNMEGKFIKNYLNCIRFQVNDKYSYIRYWGEIARHLQGAKKVFISVDGIYNSINLNTLLNTQSGKFLIDEMNIQPVANTKDIIKFGTKTKALQQNMKEYEIHLFGYPDYAGTSAKTDSISKKEDKDRGLVAETNDEGVPLSEMDTSQRFLNLNGKISILHGTKKEVLNIQDFLQKQDLNPKIYLEKDANEETLKSLKNPAILHIATHGFFLPDTHKSTLKNDKDSNRVSTNTQSNRLMQYPLLRCGLLLSGAEQGLTGQVSGTGTENGILTAQEAMNLELDETDLVVLSACETGLGEIKNGEGVYGLQRAFQQAGAKTLLMSLWKVSDSATQELMTLFYQNWIDKKQEKRTAFKNAQLELRTKYPNPFYWGAFVMVGE
jgi:CHAT domain-containing protein